MFTIDFTKPWLYKDVIYFNQGNLSINNILRCKVVTGGDTSLEGYIGEVTFVVLSRKEINGICKIVDAKNCVIDIHFPSNSLEVGENQLEIILIKEIDGKKVVVQSPAIKYEVWRGLTTGNGIQSENNYPIIIDLIGKVNNAVRVANNASATANASLKQAAKMLEDVDNTLIKANNTINNTNNAKNKALEAVEDVKKAIAAGTQDLEVKNARGKYTNLNERLDNLDKDLLKAEETTLISTVVESNFAIINETVNGYFKNFKLEGKTLISLLPNTKKLTETGYNFTIKPKFSELPKLKPNTKYYVKIFDPANKVQSWWAHSFSTGYTVQGTEGEFTSVADLSQATSFFHVYPKGYPSGMFTQDDVDKIKVVMVEGGKQEINKYFEGMKSVGDDVEEIVVSSVKSDGNLFDGELEKGTFNDVTGEFDARTSNICVNKHRFISLNKQTLFIDSHSDFKVGDVYCYDNNKKYLGVVYCNEIKTSINLKPNTKFVNFNIKANNLNDNFNVEDVNKNIYLGINSNTSLEFKSDKKKLLYYDTETQTWKKPVLREWDSIEEHSNGKYYYHKRTYLFDGKNEDLANLTYDETQSTEGIKCYYIQRDEIKRVTNCEDVVICDKLKTLSNYSKSSVGISTYTAYESANPGKNWIYFKLPIECDDVEKAKKFIKTLNMVSLLAKEEVYECAPIDLIAFENETNYMIECGTVIPKSSFKYEGCVGNVINTLKEKVSYLEYKLYKTNLANFTVALNALDTKLKLEQLTKTPK